MDKQSLMRAMTQANDGAALLTVAQIAKFRGEHANTTSRFLKGLEYTTEGKKRLYFVGDVANRILEHRVIGG